MPREWTFKMRPKNDHGEYVVRFYRFGKAQPAADYFTDDREDAIGTGRVECDRLNRARTQAPAGSDAFYAEFGVK